MSSNLPPGVTEGMIPGNRPEDADFEKILEWLYETGLDAGDIRQAIWDYVGKRRMSLDKEAPKLYYETLP